MGYFSEQALVMTVGEMAEEQELNRLDGVGFACVTRATRPTTSGLVQRRDYYTEGMLDGFYAREVWDAAETIRTTGERVVYGKSEVGRWGIDLQAVKRRTKCRACGRMMSKGTEAACFGMKWSEHQRFPTTSYAHPEPCATFTQYR